MAFALALLRALSIVLALARAFALARALTLALARAITLALSLSPSLARAFACVCAADARASETPHAGEVNATSSVTIVTALNAWSPTYDDLLVILLTRMRCLIRRWLHL